jgi:RNA polymerase sigma factor (sigma-70 family)
MLVPPNPQQAPPSAAPAARADLDPILLCRANLIGLRGADAQVAVNDAWTAYASLAKAPQDTRKWLLDRVTWTALVPVYEQYHPRMVAAAARILGGGPDSDGLACANQVWAEYATALNRHQLEGAEFPWGPPPGPILVRRAGQRAIDQFRKRRHETPASVIDKPPRPDADDQQTHSVIETGVEPEPTDEEMAEVRALEGGVLQALRSCIAALPDKNRAVVALRLEEMTWEEIGAALAIPLHTAYSQWKRALELLNGCLTTRGVRVEDLPGLGG